MYTFFQENGKEVFVIWVECKKMLDPMALWDYGRLLPISNSHPFILCTLFMIILQFWTILLPNKVWLNKLCYYDTKMRKLLSIKVRSIFKSFIIQFCILLSLLQLYQCTLYGSVSTDLQYNLLSHGSRNSTYLMIISSLKHLYTYTRYLLPNCVSGRPLLSSKHLRTTWWIPRN